MNVKPLGDRVLVQRIEAEEIKKGGIIIPDTAKEKPQQAKVISVGPGKRDDKGERVAVDVRKGDTVFLSKWAGTEVKINDEEYLLVREEDILAIVGN